MACFHKNLTQEKWNNILIENQILNIASELLRAKNWIAKKDEVYMQNSLDRAFELIDLTITDRKKWNNSRLGELLKFREILGEFYIGLNKDIKQFTRLIRVLLNFNKISYKVEI